MVEEYLVIVFNGKRYV